MPLEIIDHFQNSKTTFTRVALFDNTTDELLFTGCGVANRHPLDKHDADIGWWMAFSRALVDLSKNIDKEVNNEVGKRDNWRKQAERKDSIEYANPLAAELADIVLKSMLDNPARKHWHADFSAV